MQYPLWATPQRRQQLVRLWESYGNRCLLGHPACLEPAHYLHKRARLVEVGVAVSLPIIDPDTDLPKPGLYLNTFQVERVVEQTMEWVDDLYCLQEQAHIGEWKAEDREERSIAWEIEKRRLHAAPHKRLRKRGGFDAIARDAYLANRPIFRVLAIGVNAFSQQRVAKVELPALKKTLWVNISGVKLSRHKLRKLFRHQKGYLPEEVFRVIEQRIRGYLEG